ncbi:MAG: hypothetical protein WC382_07765 [Methanoregulaceae archaeon]|jgi:hypothetical protein
MGGGKDDNDGCPAGPGNRATPGARETEPAILLTTAVSGPPYPVIPGRGRAGAMTPSR